MKKTVIFICFFWPLVMSIISVQRFSSAFFSFTVSQLLAYSNMVFLFIGIMAIIKNLGPLSKTARLWIIFYVIYYCFAMVASIFQDGETFILRSLVPVVFFIGFYLLLSIEEYRNYFFSIITFSFILSALLTILLYKLNFDMEKQAIYIYKLDRAQGVYGDANNAALVSIFAYIFFNKLYITKNTIQKVIKIGILLIILYSLFLTFSTTGLAMFIIVLVLLNYKLFTKQRLPFLAGFMVIGYVITYNLKSLTAGMDLSIAQKDKIDNIVNLMTLNFGEVDTSGRGLLLENLFKYIYENPILGNGVDFFTSVKGHNTYFGIWADAGFFTFVVFCTILIIHLVKLLKLPLDMRFFCLSILLTLYVFMYSLQSVLNQPYLIALFVYIGYIIDGGHLDKIYKKENNRIGTVI